MEFAFLSNSKTIVCRNKHIYPKEKYTSKLYNILNLVWHNYNTTFFIIYQDTFKKIAKHTKRKPPQL